MCEHKKIHQWEHAGVGQAPFKVKGLFDMPSKALLEANPEAFDYAMSLAPRDCPVGTCHVCGRPIKINYIIEDATGYRFPVGCKCVEKTGSAGLVEQVKLLKKERARKKREEKRERERLERLEQQRQRNGGLTDYELSEKKRTEREQERQKKIAPTLEILRSLADELKDGRDGFRDSVARDLEKGRLPVGQGKIIMIEILAKQAGRKNSKAYQDRYERIEIEVCLAERVLNG